MKHNKAVHCNQFKKDIHPLIKTWFNQPARHQKRRQTRQTKLATGGSRPINRLLPVVRCCGQKYNHKLRAGRGFTAEELKAVGLNMNSARSVGIAIDPRRRNKKEETKNRNVERLREYLAKLVVFPRKESKVNKTVRAGVPADTLKSAVEGKTFVSKVNNRPAKPSTIVSF